jgi:hypothetical protein
VLQPSSDAAQRLQEGLKGQYKQQLHNLLTAKAQQQQQQDEKESKEGEDVPAAAAAATGASAAEDTAAAAAAAAAAAPVPVPAPEPVVHIHRVQIVEVSDDEDEDYAGGSGSIEDVLPKGAEVLLRVTPPQQQPAQPKQEAAAGSSKAGGKAGTQSAHKLTAPRTSAEFTTTARSLAGSGDAQQLGAYVQLLQPGQYGALFRNNLDPQSLGLMLQGLEQLSAREPGAAHSGLAALTRVPRFSFVWAMADGGSKARAQALLEQLAASGRDVGDSLRATYGVQDTAKT